VFGLIAVLSEKDADGILRALAPVLESAVFIGLPSESLQRAGRSGAGTRDPADLAAIAERLGLPSGVEPDATAGLSRVRRLAADSGGTVLVVGSHYLIAALGGNWQ
jgi:dihydrofolate synthase/folylpolyglutamate synthase